LSIIFGGAGGSSNTGAYQASIRPLTSDFTNQAYPPRHGIINQPPPFITPATSLNFETHFETGTPSLPSQMSLSRTTVATYWNSSGVLTSASANTARFDYDPNTLALKGLLVEGAMDNNSWSSDWVNSWVFNDVTATSVADPMGGTLAKKLVPTSTVFRHDADFNTNAAISIAGPCTYSVYAKANGYTQVGIADSVTHTSAAFTLSGSGSVAGTFNGSNGVGGTVTATGIQNCGNGWYRCWFSFSLGGTSNVGLRLYALDGSYTTGSGDLEATYWWGGNGTDGVTFFGSQIEQSGKPPTSYIPTAGASITRSADIVSSTDATWLSSNAYVMETGELFASTAATMFGFDTSIGLGYDSTNHLTTAAGGTQTSGNTGTLTGTNRGGIAFDGTPRVSIDLNGGTVVTAANSASKPSTLYFGNTNNGASGFLNGHIRSLAGYVSLTDADMPTVTTVGAAYTPAATASGDGSSAGSNTATAVGAWIQSGDGSAAGGDTATAVGRWLLDGVGSSAGSDTATATGAWLQSGVGSSAGTDTATATGAWLQSGVGSAAGANTATATAAPIQAKVGSAAGSNTATAVGAWLQSGVGSETGSDTATATGAWLQSGVGSSAGSDTASGTGAKLQAGVGSSAGSNTATATGAWLQSGVGSSAGTDTAAATGHWLQSGVGNAQGDNTASGYSPGVANVGSSSGSNTATAVGAWLQSGVGSSSGTNTASAVGLLGGIVTGDGLSVGANIATAIGAWLQAGTGTAIGGNVASAFVEVSEADFNNDFAQDFSGFPGAEAGLGQGDFNNDYNDDFAVFHVGRIVSGTGTSVGGNVADAVGSTIVFIPPVYPPVPVPPPQVWHPAREYHRVQAPRATRIYRHGTELRRRPPQGMKRRYG
jgi:hypothetical protein